MNLDAEAILRTPADQPEKLFSKERYDEEYKALLKAWHPDLSHHPQAAQVTAHLNGLRDVAISKIRAGIWVETVRLRVLGTDHKTRSIKYSIKKPFELGTLYYGQTNVTYAVDHEHKGLYDRAISTISLLHYANDKMKAEIGRYMPNIVSTFDAGGKHFMVLKKPAHTYSLTDLAVSQGGYMIPEHAAWIMSCVLNMSSYLEWAGIVHGDISADSLFVDPQNHSCYLLGGWWYATDRGGKLVSLPTRTYAVTPHDVAVSGVADARIDLLSGRLLGREMLQGFPGDVPLPMRNFFAHPSSGSAKEDYRIWKDVVLPESFGARRFVELNITDSDVFKKEN